MIANQHALIPSFLIQRGNTLVLNFLAVGAGLILLSALAQISIPLPFTPVPITGQTFGVFLISLLWGKKRATTIVTAYLIAGALEFPVFASGRAGLTWGPTFGYLIGMLLASFCVGYLADQGWTRKFFTTYLACVVGSALIFATGLIVLSNFVPRDQLLTAGFWPFLPGDLVKSLLASYLVYQSEKLRE